MHSAFGSGEPFQARGPSEGGVRIHGGSGEGLMRRFRPLAQPQQFSKREKKREKKRVHKRRHGAVMLRQLGLRAENG